RAALKAANDELAALAQKGTTNEEFDRARTKCESVEREIIALAQASSGAPEHDVALDAESLAARLGDRVAAVAFRRYDRSRVSVAGGRDSAGPPAVNESSIPSLCAFVVRGRARASTSLADPSSALDRDVRDAGPASALTV